MSPQSTALQTTDMEAKEYELLYSAVAHQSYPEGITKNQKDVLRNKEEKIRGSRRPIVLLCKLSLSPIHV